jgi:hypothetical protein
MLTLDREIARELRLLAILVQKSVLSVGSNLERRQSTSERQLIGIGLLICIGLFVVHIAMECKLRILGWKVSLMIRSER